MKRRSSPFQEDCVNKLKLLADATRLAVLEILMQGPKHVGEINSFLTLDQSLLSHHLKVLREGGLVEAVREGKEVLYSLASGVGVARSEKSINLGCCRLSFN